jgi:hypothetical protein
VRRAAIVVAVALLSLSSSAARAALPETSPQQMEEAKRRYGEGQAKYLAGRHEEALAILVQSYALYPSPNSGLLIARCLFELNRPVEAYEKFQEVENAALELVREGETRYGETAAAAAKEKAAARAKIAILKLSSRAGVSATIDGKPVALSVAGDGLAFHDPGPVKIVFKKDGYEDAHAISAEAGKETLVSFRPPADAPPAPPPSPSPPITHEARGVPWYGYVSGGIAVVGLASFVGFGLSSESTYSGLDERCAPRCTGADRDEADTGRRQQTFANIGLVVGVVAGLITTIIVLSR